MALNGETYASLAAAQAAAAPVLAYGSFIKNMVDFLIVAIVIFLLIKGINRWRRNPPRLPLLRRRKNARTASRR